MALPHNDKPTNIKGTNFNRDFNTILQAQVRVVGDDIQDHEIKDFADCVAT